MAFSDSDITVQDVNVRVKHQFGDEAGVQVSDDDILRWINDGQREIVQKNSILRAKADTNIVNGQNKYTFPSDILTLNNITYEGKPLKAMSFQDAQQYILNIDPGLVETGTPLFWYEWANELSLYPKPDADIVNGLTIYYIKLPSKVTSSIDKLSLPDRYFDRLMEYVMSKAYEMDDDIAASNNQLQKMEASLNSQHEVETEYQTNFYPTITVLIEDM